jgi:hypothetical protein
MANNCRLGFGIHPMHPLKCTRVPGSKFNKSDFPHIFSGIEIIFTK